MLSLLMQKEVQEAEVEVEVVLQKNIVKELIPYSIIQYFNQVMLMDGSKKLINLMVLYSIQKIKHNRRALHKPLVMIVLSLTASGHIQVQHMDKATVVEE